MRPSCCTGTCSGLQCQCRNVCASDSRTADSSSILLVARSSLEASRSSSLERPDAKTGLVWRARSNSFGPESILDFRSGQPASPGRHEAPPGLGLASAPYGRLGREQPAGAGEVRGLDCSTVGRPVSQRRCTASVTAAALQLACRRRCQTGKKLVALY